MSIINIELSRFIIYVMYDFFELYLISIESEERCMKVWMSVSKLVMPEWPWPCDYKKIEKQIFNLTVMYYRYMSLVVLNYFVLNRP